MLLNYDKTIFMQFSSNVSYRSLVNTQSIDYKINLTNYTKFLGIILESSLTWKKHIDHINPKLNSLGYMLPSFRPVLIIENHKTDLFFLCSFSIKLRYHILG